MENPKQKWMMTGGTISGNLPFDPLLHEAPLAPGPVGLRPGAAPQPLDPPGHGDRGFASAQAAEGHGCFGPDAAVCGGRRCVGPLGRQQ